MRIVVSPHNVVNYPPGGGHFWVYMQYVDGLRRIGCDVWWLEEFRRSGDAAEEESRVAILRQRLARFGMDDRIILYAEDGEFVNCTASHAQQVFRDADLLLNFHQRMNARMLEQFRLTALVDIDPGLLQYWITSGLLAVERHDLYFTTGETVGKPDAKFPDCGLQWIQIRPPVSLDLWPRLSAPIDRRFTTVSNWWGHEWVTDDEGVHDNNKRTAFLEFAELPRHTRVPLELALLLDPKDASDVADGEMLQREGWRVRHAHDVAGSPQDYRTYIQGSRGEFSCAKWSCMKFQNAWISDRTLCYLATGRPAVVQDTGPSAIFTGERGLLRFSTLDEAAAALDEAEAHYELHARAARELAELFDARRVAETIVRHAGARPMAAQR
ncbi:MAG: hypothetical protein JO146_07795 [Candidatus Eremiobacteraeota bacterium]|nr:hypothetical protein [Candidatus Eremiobacteraeota bacterium]